MRQLVPCVSNFMYSTLWSRFPLRIYDLLCLTTSAAATSRSLGKMGGSGPTGVMLYTPQEESQHALKSQSVDQKARMNDTMTDERIDLLMTPGVMPLDVLKLGRVAEGGQVPVQLPEPLVQRGVSRPDVAQVALEVLHVHDVEADDGRVQSDVSLGDVLAEIVWARGRGQVLFDPVERVEELRDGFFVRGLRAAEPRASDLSR